MIKQTIGLLFFLFFYSITPLQAQITPKSVKSVKTTAIDSLQLLAKEWFDKGLVKFNLNNFAESTADFDMSIQLKPDAVTYHYRANALYKLGRYPQALTDYDASLRLNPNPNVYLNRAVALRNMGKYKEAIADYDVLIRLNPNNAAAYNGRGVALVALKQYALAILDYNKAIVLNPNYAKAYANKGCCLVQINDKKSLQEALVWIDKALSLDVTLLYAKECKTEALHQLTIEKQ
jgi:tetratricopeptide (TPR) repeat protein